FHVTGVQTCALPISAIDGAGGRVLLIVVVNAAEPLAASTWPAHRELLAALRQEGPAQALPDEQAAWLVRATAHDLLLLDRASPGGGRASCTERATTA